MLYELLVGELPFSTKEVRGANPTAMRRMLLDKDAPRPSTRLRARSNAKRDTLPTLRALRSDLDWVVLKALEKDPERRYETPDALAEDLRRFLEHEPLIAGPPSASYRIKKLLRRHRLAFAAAGAVLTTAISGAVVAIDFAIEARAQEAIAKQRSSDFDLLSAVLHQERALEHKNQLYPATPSKLPQMRAWMAQECDPLVAMRGTIAATIDKLAASERSGGSEATSTEFLVSALRTLLPKLDALSDLERPQVEQLVRWAEYLAEIQGRDHADAPTTWQQCRLAIAAADDVVASTRYRGVAIDFDHEAFLGLVPLGINPKTKLLEFYDLRSAWDGTSDPRTISIPRLATDGSIRVGPKTGIVFVLLPGGHVELGAQNTDKNAPRYESVDASLTPPYRVRLDPFLIARHELTRAQWKRLWTWDSSEAEPSFFTGDGRAAGKRMLPTNPVDHMNWHMADSIVRRNAMSLPTVAQWEYAARAGTDTPWWCGTSQEDLEGKANLCDKTGKRFFSYWGHSVPFDDGHVFHAVVGTFAASPFGLHDVHGNVSEWCSDVAHDNPDVRDGDGRRGGGTDRGYAATCGGDFGDPADHARAALLASLKKDMRAGETGLRAVRLLHPQ
jgi:formylglycine-generating enzyme required for sulfatase activity